MGALTFFSGGWPIFELAGGDFTPPYPPPYACMLTRLLGHLPTSGVSMGHIKSTSTTLLPGRGGERYFLLEPESESMIS